MKTGDAAAETVGGVEIGAVAVGDGDGRRGEGRVNSPRAAALQQRDGGARIDRPMPEEPADEPQRLPVDVERRRKIGDDGIIVAGVEAHVIAPRQRHGADHVERLIAVEGGDLDRHHRGDLEKPAPESMRQHPPPDRRLEIEADQWNHLRHRPAMIEECGFVSCNPGQAQQPGVVAELCEERSLGRRLPGRPTDPADRHHRPAGPADLLGCEFEDRPQQADVRIADRKLGGVDTNGQAAGTGGEVIASQGPLPTLVERAR